MSNTLLDEQLADMASQLAQIVEILNDHDQQIAALVPASPGSPQPTDERERFWRIFDSQVQQAGRLGAATLQQIREQIPESDRRDWADFIGRLMGLDQCSSGACYRCENAAGQIRMDNSPGKINGLRQRSPLLNQLGDTVSADLFRNQITIHCRALVQEMATHETPVVCSLRRDF